MSQSNELYKAVLLGITFDTQHPASDEIVLRYNDAQDTYTQRLLPVSQYVYGSMDHVAALDIDPQDKVFMQFLEFADAGAGPDITPRRLVLHAANEKSVVLYDDKNILSEFKYAFSMQNNAVIVLGETQKATKEVLGIK